MNILRKVLLVLLLLVAVGMETAVAQQYRTHVVKSGQTLYSISKAYGVTVNAIIQANPTLKDDKVPAGMSLRIPPATTTPVPMPLVPEVKIQTPGDKIQQEQSSRSQITPRVASWSTAGEGHWTDGVLNIAVILPFNLDALSTSENKTQMRSVEFYEGVLMAVDEMQQKGRRVQVQAHDLSTTSLYRILYGQSIQEADVIIAPMDEPDVRQVAEWGQGHGTPVVSPFVFNSELLSTNEHLLQVNTPKSMLYPALTDELLSRFDDYTFVFVTDETTSKFDPYPEQLKKSLQKNHRSYKELSFRNPEKLMACDSILGIMDDNVLFVPVTPQASSMRRMLSGLQHVKILRSARYQAAMLEGRNKPEGQPKLSVLGYPEWALSTNEFGKYYYDLDVYMFTKVYPNPFDSDLKSFYADFKRWFGKEPMALMPKYALLGYDCAKYFLNALSHNGENLEARIETQGADGLQTNFCFDRSMGKGFFNRGFYLVHFTPDATIEKIALQ